MGRSKPDWIISDLEDSDITASLTTKTRNEKLQVELSQNNNNLINMFLSYTYSG